MQRVVPTAVACLPLLIGAWGPHSTPAPRPLVSRAARFVGPPDACSLLTDAQVSAAIEATAQPGKPPIAGAAGLCIWSDDPNAGIGNRRVTLTIISSASFDHAKSGSALVTIVPAAGIGDDAYYEIWTKGSESPFLNVRKGGATFQVRILNGLKFKPFTLDQEKAKEADLGKAAAAKL